MKSGAPRASQRPHHLLSELGKSASGVRHFIYSDALSLASTAILDHICSINDPRSRTSGSEREERQFL